jgi:hypothetical protein
VAVVAVVLATRAAVKAAAVVVVATAVAAAKVKAKAKAAATRAAVKVVVRAAVHVASRHRRMVLRIWTTIFRSKSISPDNKNPAIRPGRRVFCCLQRADLPPF